MKRFQSILCASLLTLAMSSATFAGTIYGAPSTDKDGTIYGAPCTDKDGTIYGAPSTDKDGTIYGAPCTGKDGTIYGAPGTIYGFTDEAYNAFLGLLTTIL